MPRVVQLADFRPSPRHDGQPWTSVRVEQADNPTEDWEEVSESELEPTDSDASRPALRSVTAQGDKPWRRLVFLRDEEEDAPQPFVFAEGAPFLPLVSAVSPILFARTYSGAEPDPDEPMKVLAGGEVQGEFSDTTRPTADEVEEKYIPQSARDVALELGTVPGELLEDARRVSALRAATEIERAKAPEQATEGKTLYQTLRMTYQEEVDKLAGTLQWWVLANGAPPSRPVTPWLGLGFYW